MRIDGLFVGREEVTVGAGTFAARHFQFIDDGTSGLDGEHPPYDLWITDDEDGIFLKGGVGGYMMTWYELVELKRWSEHLGIPIHLEPRYLSAPPDVGARWVLSALESGTPEGLAMAGGVMRARWAEEADTADPAVLGEIARRAGLDAEAIASRAQTPEIQAKLDANTARAIEARVFGSPWYVYRGEPFWGQDRLDFLARALSK